MESTEPQKPTGDDEIHQTAFTLLHMIDLLLPTTDGWEVILTRNMQPEPDQGLLLRQLELRLPEKPPPSIRALKSSTA